MAAKDQNCSDKFTQLYLQYYQNMIRYATSIVFVNKKVLQKGSKKVSTFNTQ